MRSPTYSDEEIAQLIKAARALAPPLKAATYATLIGLLSVTGMRVGEAIGLDRDDVDLDDGWLLIRRAKNDHHRVVPLHHSTVQALGAYACLRDRLCPQPATDSFLVTSTGRRPHPSTVGGVFGELRDVTGLSEQRSPSGRLPRMHDMRHAFMLRTLLGWYRDGSDVAALLPVLSTFVGTRRPEGKLLVFRSRTTAAGARRRTT